MTKKRHYVDHAYRQRGVTACGVDLITPGKTIKGGKTNPWVTEDMDRVTCRRLSQGMGDFLSERAGMTIQYTKAVRENVPLMIAFAGGTGSGKTYSAMRLAAGICGDEPFRVGDTENRRALHYAGTFNFEHKQITAPFTPEKYLEFVNETAARGFPAALVDSMSHEWEGIGGIRDMADKSTKKTPANWIEPKDRHRKMLAGFMQADIHIIFCLRAREKTDWSEVDASGKMDPRPLGWWPICEKDFMYEMGASFTFEDVNEGVINLALPHKLEDEHRMAFLPGQHVTEESGRMLAEWARGGTIEAPDKELWDRARRAAQDGKDVLQTFVNTQITPEERAKLKPIGRELNKSAKQADANRAGEAFSRGADEDGGPG